MFDVYLTDVQKKVQFEDYPGEHPVKFILDFKKIFPSWISKLMFSVLIKISKGFFGYQLLYKASKNEKIQ